MNNLEELYADLFAYRFSLQDIYEDNETEIIKKLKMKLIELNYNRNDINNIIYNFYRFYNIQIDLIEIQNTGELISYNIQNHINLISRLRELLNENIGLELNENIQEDVKITVNETAINNLPIIIVEKDIEENCSICMEQFKKENKLIKLDCKHMFHINCIKEYLLNYDYKCPLCRCDVGSHKYS